MKIALVEPVGGHGGMNYYDMSLSQALAKSNVEVNWYTCDETKEKSVNNIKIHKFFYKIYSKNLPTIFRAILFILGLLFSLIHARSTNCKIVHIHFFHYTKLEYIFVWLIRFFKFKYILTAHDIQSFIEGDNDNYSKFVLKNASEIIVHNFHSLDSLSEKARTLNIELNSVNVIPHGNYNRCISKVDKSISRKKLGFPDNKKILLFFGQIKKVKGLDILLESLKRLDRNDYLLVIAGKVWKEDWQVYQRIIDDNQLADRIKLEIRYIEDNEVDYFFSAADFIILPYREIFQSGVLLMAMSYGLIPIVSDLRGMTEIIEDKENGFIFKTGSSSSLADVLGSLVLGECDYSFMKTKVLETINGKFDWDNIALRTKEVYEGV